MFGYDDALDCFGVHGVGGMAGAILTGVFAIEQYGGTAGLLEGNAGQVLNQIEGVAIVIVYDAIVSLIILKIVDGHFSRPKICRLSPHPPAHRRTRRRRERVW